ncbi:MAG: hypothetical protein R2707_05425 [Acidimicrobiales bacterium]
MTMTVVRSAGCLPPVTIERVVDDPDGVRAMAERNGPYFMPGRYLVGGATAHAAADGTILKHGNVPPGVTGPVWRGDWAIGGEARIDGADELLHSTVFIEAARQLFDAEVVRPEQLFVNLTGPRGGDSFSHTDIPEFVGIDRSNAPGWFLSAMGVSGQFEDVRKNIATAVCWFHRGDRGYFRYWPDGRDAPSVRHEDMWNTGVMGDNDFMHHQVEKVGQPDAVPVQGLSIDSLLDHDGTDWVVTDEGAELGRLDDLNVRLSLSWKAKVYADGASADAAQAGVGGIGLADALDRLAEVIDEPIAATGPDALSSVELRDQLTARFSSYRSDRT